MRALQTMAVDGGYVSARLTGTTARVVTSTTPGLRPESMPLARLRDRTAGSVRRSPLVPCGDVRRPARFSGLGMLSVLTIDLERGLDPIDHDAVMTGGQIVYGSQQSLYVATERWLDPADAEARRLSGIDRDPSLRRQRPGGDRVQRRPARCRARCSASGRCPSTRGCSGSPRPRPRRGRSASRARAESESFVSVLGERSGRLVEVGRVGDLGRGEQIYAVRFIGEVGYVVTFRQVDPLYTLDLSDPARPRTLGELKIPGYSAYLHPVGAGALLGVGQDATADGALLGAHLSLFDVSDLTRPARVDRHSLGPGSQTEVEYDHHAFFWSAPDELAVVPVQIYGGARRGFLGAVALRVGAQGTIERLGRLSHGRGWRSAIRRSLVVGDRLFTYSARGVMAHDLATLTEQGWAAFARGARSLSLPSFRHVSLGDHRRGRGRLRPRRQPGPGPEPRRAAGRGPPDRGRRHGRGDARRLPGGPAAVLRRRALRGRRPRARPRPRRGGRGVRPARRLLERRRLRSRTRSPGPFELESFRLSRDGEDALPARGHRHDDSRARSPTRAWRASSCPASRSPTSSSTRCSAMPTPRCRSSSTWS